MADGVLNNGAYNVDVDGLILGANGELTNTSTGDLIIDASNVSNSGTITLNSNGTTCGDNDDIQIRSDDGTQRTWAGSGTFVIVDVHVENQGGNRHYYCL